MCLDGLTQKRTLKKDKVVWKFVDIINGGEYPIMHHLSFCLSKQRKIKARPLVVASIGDKIYIPYFHCFVSREDAIGYLFGPELLEFIIPKGTIVQYGYHKDGGKKRKCVVSPVLINPRVKE